MYDTNTMLFSNIKLKLGSLKYVPQMPLQSRTFSVESWDALENRVVQMQIGGSTEAEINWRVKTFSSKIYVKFQMVL